MEEQLECLAGVASRATAANMAPLLILLMYIFVEETAFALQYGHGVGLSIWEKPIFSRLVSFDHPEELKEGMVFALETYWPSSDGWGAARIEEEVVVTATGCQVITKFPAEDLLIAGQRYYAVGGPLPLQRDSQSHLNTVEGRGGK